MTTIATQIREMLFNDDRLNTDIGKRFRMHANTISGIRNGDHECSVAFAEAYIQAMGWRWKLKGHNYTGDVREQLSQAIRESSRTTQQIAEAAGCDQRAVDAILGGGRTPQVRIIDGVTLALGLRWITWEIGK